MKEDELDYIIEIAFHKWTSHEKKMKKKALKRAHRGTNWNSLKKRPGYVSVKLPGTKRYVLVRQSAMQRVTKRKVGKALGMRKSLRK